VDTPEEAQKAIDIGMDVLQVPASVFDRRFQRAGIFEKAHAAGMTVFVRSVYGRGGFWMNPETISAARHRIYYRFKKYLEGQYVYSKSEIKPFMYWYIRNMAPHAIPVIGADTPEQVEENIRIARLFDGWDEQYPEDDMSLYPENWSEK